MARDRRHIYNLTHTDEDGDVIMTESGPLPSSHVDATSQYTTKNSNSQDQSSSNVEPVSLFHRSSTLMLHVPLSAQDVLQGTNIRPRSNNRFNPPPFSQVSENRERSTNLHAGLNMQTRGPQNAPPDSRQAQPKPVTSLQQTATQHPQVNTPVPSVNRQLPPIASLLPAQFMTDWADRPRVPPSTTSRSSTNPETYNATPLNQARHIHVGARPLIALPLDRLPFHWPTQVSTGVNHPLPTQATTIDAAAQDDRLTLLHQQTDQLLNAVMSQREFFDVLRQSPVFTPDSRDNEAIQARRLAVPTSRRKKIEQTKKAACTACMEDFIINDLVSATCGCRYCHDCLNRVFKSGCTSVADFPPKCHGKALRINVFGPILEQEVVERYKKVEAEFSCKRPFYCALQTCSAFIPEKDIVPVGGYAICGSCNQCTCTTCNMLLSSHEYGNNERTCPTEPEELRALRSLCEDEEWKQCPSCHVMVEKIDGCDHIECQCGVEFCYRCGSYYTEFDECDCGAEDVSDEEEEREDDDHEAWPQHQRMLDPLGRPVCFHYSTELMPAEICHGCLRSPTHPAHVHSCNECGIELCKDCLDGIRAMNGDVPSSSDDDDSMSNE